MDIRVAESRFVVNLDLLKRHVGPVANELGTLARVSQESPEVEEPARQGLIRIYCGEAAETPYH